ncbi:hypothetical protein F4225_07115, partial [Candidatus Poribacteria bacterium]|nr:hypothetical protein [Candidatus Poribacteria bacterium]
MVNLTHEQSLLREIDNLASNNQIQKSVGLNPHEVRQKIKRLIQITRQRIKAVEFHLNLIESTDLDYYLQIQFSPPSESEDLLPPKTLVDFSGQNSVDVLIELLENKQNTLREESALVVFIVLNGFFSNLISLDDCVAKIINITYNLFQNDHLSYKVPQKLKNKKPNGQLTAHLQTFYAIGQAGNKDKTGSSFNIAREIRNQLIHDDIDSVVHPLSPLSGFASEPKLIFYNSFFPANTSLTSPATEIITFCQHVFQETVDFVDNCYRLTCDDLQ